MNIYLAATLTLLYYILYPVLFILQLLVRILASLLSVAGFILLPFVYLGRFLLDTLVFPFRFIARFETLYTYVGIAALVGVIIGSLLYFSSTSLISSLHLGSPDLTPHMPRRSIASYRQARREKGTGYLGPHVPPNMLNTSIGPRHGMLSPPTILEEDDSDS